VPAVRVNQRTVLVMISVMIWTGGWLG